MGAGHERAASKYADILVLDHYLEVLRYKPGALKKDSTASRSYAREEQRRTTMGEVMTFRSGKSYEFQVMRHLVQQRQHITFELDARVPDTTGQYERKIDVWLPDTREIVECKHHTTRVGIEIVDRLVGTTQDVNAKIGLIFSSSGFTPQAEMRAQKDGIACITFPFATKFETLFPPAGDGHYVGEYVELCRCSTPPSPTGDLWGRISYVSGNDEAWSLCAAVSVDWRDVKAHRFIAYLVLVHMLGRPPSDVAINEFVDNYGDRFEIGQESMPLSLS